MMLVLSWLSISAVEKYVEGILVWHSWMYYVNIREYASFERKGAMGSKRKSDIFALDEKRTLKNASTNDVIALQTIQDLFWNVSKFLERGCERGKSVFLRKLVLLWKLKSFKIRRNMEQKITGAAARAIPSMHWIFERYPNRNRMRKGRQSWLS